MSKKEHMIIPVFVPHKGCPFECIYCNQKSISGEHEEMTSDKIKHIIESYLKSSEGCKVIDVGFYGGSFTGIDYNEQIEFLNTAYQYVIRGLVREIRLSTRPDYIDENVLEYLGQYGVGTIELGVQTLDAGVLSQSSRGHTVDDVIRASQLISSKKFKLGLQTMIGLPGDTEDKDIATALKVIELEPVLVRIYPTLVIKDTYLEELYRNGKYMPLSLDKAVDICTHLVEMYEQKNIDVIRIGLQPTDTINEGMDVVAGPFHPAFRQLVEASIMLKKIEREIILMNLTDVKNLAIIAGSRRVSDIRGQKNSNINYLKSKYKYNQIKILPDENLDRQFIVKPM